MRILMLTSVWPTPQHPEHAPFVVRQVNFLRKQGVDVDVFHVDGKKNPARYFRAWMRVRSLLARGRYDVVHAQWAQSALASLPAKRPLVVTFHGSDVQGIVDANQHYSTAGWTLQNIARRVARVADEAIVVASRLAKLLPKRDYHIIPNGLDLELFRPIPQAEARALLGLPTAGRLILFPASPANPVKRFHLAQAVVQHLDRRHGAELLVISGIDPKKMPFYMNACDVLLLTSAHEGSPNVIKEALACNLPIVSTDVGDVRERVENIDGCAICESGDPQDLSAALSAVLDRGRRTRGRDTVGELDESLLTRKLVAVYERALKSRAAC